MFKNILVPFDLSSQSTRAFKMALDIAKNMILKLHYLLALRVMPGITNITMQELILN